MLYLLYMKYFLDDIEKLTEENTNYRKILFTTKNSQLVVMSIEPGDEIGEEIHELDQFIRLEKGSGEAILNDSTHPIKEDFAIVIPSGTKHNIINTGNIPLKLYTIYSPPEHKFNTIHETKADEREEHFDGTTDLD